MTRKRSKRMELVFQTLLKEDSGRGMSAQELADRLGLNRANVSHDLNELWRAGRIEKRNGRPVLFSASSQRLEQNQETGLDRLARTNPSLAASVEQAKAAILYPPRGMHALILGETGVGKTMFAGLMHSYAIEIGKRPVDAPFVTFNCADYAHNPHLLLGQLFGVRKGAYTGAEGDRIGLLEQADGGFLFLDEVHRLPAEGQEMLFTFMDKGVFRPLGGTEERRADVLIVSATTENPDSALLVTFARRIPMFIRLPSLQERGLRERLGLIFRFFREESHRLGMEIHVSANAVRAFLVYPCPNNVGQLKTDIQLGCARAYADHITGKKAQVEVTTAELPAYVNEGLLQSKELRFKLEELIGSTQSFYLFHPDQEPLSLEREKGGQTESVYDHIEKLVEQLRAQGVSNEEIDLDLENYFSQYIRRVSRIVPRAELGKIVHSRFLSLAESVTARAESMLGKPLNRQILFSLALHIQTLAERMKRGKQVVHPQLSKLSAKYPREFRAALECVELISSELNLVLTKDEAGFLTMFFTWEEPEADAAAHTVGVLVMTHGSGGATAMVDVTNRLLGVDFARAVDVPIDMEPGEALEKAIEVVRRLNLQAGLLLLVDMGSLVAFGTMIERKLGIPVKVISLVSTPHVIEATRKALLGHSLAEIYRDVRNLSPFEPDEVHPSPHLNQPRAVIVTACTTGGGSALAIKQMLKRHLRFDDQLVEIIPIQIADMDEMRERLRVLKRERQVLCVISPFAVDRELPHYRVEDVLHLEAIREIQRKIDLEETYRHMQMTLRSHLQHVDGQAIVPDVRDCLARLQKALNFRLDEEDLVGITLHMCCMLDRQLSGEKGVVFPRREEYLTAHEQLYQTVCEELRPFAQKYSIQLSPDEICYLLNFFVQANTHTH